MCKKSFGYYFRNFASFISILFFIFNCKIGYAKPELIDRIAAIVNHEVILYSDIQKKINSGQPVIISFYPAKKNDDVYVKALQDQINFELILQKADEVGLEVSDDDVEKQITSFLKQRGLSREGLLKALQAQGINLSQYKDDFKNQMIVRKFQGHVIGPMIKITDKDVENYYLKKSGSSADSMRLSLRNIYIKLPADASDAVKNEIKNRADEVYKKLQNGMKFEEATKMYSDAPNAIETGGLMPELRLKDLSPTIRKHVSKLEPKKFTPPILVPNGFYIFYLENKSFVSNNEFSKQRTKLQFELRTHEIAKQTEEWLSNQRSRSTIIIKK